MSNWCISEIVYRIIVPVANVFLTAFLALLVNLLSKFIWAKYGQQDHPG
uniref:Uncharacterized protein n=1 Tax=Acrobeloides nanus TaxID=290746 RepID=A0A914E4R8_9BILA